MTRYYRRAGFSFAKAKLHTKLLVTLFLVSVLGGIGVAWLQIKVRAGLDAKAQREWILGNEDDPAPTEFKDPKSERELVAITHDHAFSLPMLLFVVLHLVALSPIPDWTKIALNVLGFGSCLGALAAPWLIARSLPGATLVLQLSGLGLFISLGLSSLICLFDLWLLGPLIRWSGRKEPPSADPLNLRGPAPAG